MPISRQAPHHQRQPPQPAVTEIGEGKRGEGPRDQEKNADLIEHAEELPRPRSGKTMRQRRGTIQGHERRGVDAATEILQSVAVLLGRADEDGRTGEAQEQAEAVGQLVRRFLRDAWKSDPGSNQAAHWRFALLCNGDFRRQLDGELYSYRSVGTEELKSTGEVQRKVARRIRF